MDMIKEMTDDPNNFNSDECEGNNCAFELDSWSHYDYDVQNPGTPE